MKQKPAHIAALALAVALALVLGAVVDAASEDIKKQYGDIKDQIQEQQKKLHQAQKAESITLAELERTNRRLVEVEKDLKSYRARLAKTRKELDTTRSDVDTLEEKISQRKGWLRRKLKAMQQYGKHGDTVLILGSANDLPQLLRRWHYLGAIASVEARILDELNADVTELRKKRAELTVLAERLEREESDVARTEQSLRKQQEDRKIMLTALQKRKDDYEHMLRELRKSAARMQKLISQSEGASTDTSYSGKGFRGLKGRLPWPVRGRIAIPYGSQKDVEFNTPVFRNGIYISTSADSIARAVHSGRVVYADWFKGYGQLVIVNHGQGYHSLYGNLSEIFLKAGDIIERDTKIGRVGTSGMIDRPSLYFEVRYKGRPLNPSQWLSRK